MPTLNPNDLIKSLEWRYAVKKFDATRKISALEWSALEKALVLTPSSYGLQAWKFIVITDQALRDSLVQHSWGQRQVADCSHFVVFARRSDATENDVKRYINRIAEVREADPQSLSGFYNIMVEDFVKGPRHQHAKEWLARQLYIALGNFMTSAATLGIDTCPMEGIIPAEYDRILKLPESGYNTVCACAAGYRAADDANARAKKVRFELEDVIVRI